MSVKLESSDKKIVLVDQNVIKQMVTIQTMLDNLSFCENNNDEPIPIYAVKGEILNKVIEWIKFHFETTTIPESKDWEDRFFKTNLEKIFKIEEAADYLEVNNLMLNGQVFIDKHYEMITATEAFKNLSREKLRLLFSRDGLNVSNEQTVVQSLQTWISADPEERSKCLEYLMPYIRASFLPSQFIENLSNFFAQYSQPLCQQLNFEKKTPRQGYDLCIVAVLRRGEERCLEYLDTKVSCN